MISRRTKIQLVIFAVITLLGVSFVGARYARLDRMFFDDQYTVVAHFDDSGGAYAGGEVSYRGVTIGKVEKLVLTNDGVDIHLGIDNKWDKIPMDSLAVVQNRSAVGEQYVDLQPRADDGPFLKNKSEIAEENTRIPIPTVKLLSDISETVSHVDKEALKTVVSELGTAFDGTGEDLGQIIDTSNSFIEAANENFDITTALIQDSNTVLHGQLASASAIRTFAKNLSLFSTTLAGADPDLRRLIDNGSSAANELRTFIEDNKIDLASLLNNLRTTGEIVVKHIDGLQQILVLYPYVVVGTFTVVSKDLSTGRYDAHFGMVTTDKPLCHKGYEGTDTRPPQETANRPLNKNARCTEPATLTNARGAQHAPRAATSYQSPIVGQYDPSTGKFSWTGDGPTTLSERGSVAPRVPVEESWKWLLLQPLVNWMD